MTKAGIVLSLIWVLPMCIGVVSIVQEYELMQLRRKLARRNELLQPSRASEMWRFVPHAIPVAVACMMILLTLLGVFG
jgi:hypothetical protein